MGKYVIHTLTVSQDGGQVESKCIDITFTNFGDNANPPVGSTLIVDGIVIPPGTEWVIVSEKGDINVTNHKMRWDDSTGTVRNAMIQRKLPA